MGLFAIYGVYLWYQLEENQMLLDKIYDLVEPVVDDLDYILWGIELVGTGKITVRIFIDHENGVSVDDCQKVSRDASAIF